MNKIVIGLQQTYLNLRSSHITRSMFISVCLVLLISGVSEPQQVNVSLELPPPFKFMVEDLWKLTITNQSEPRDVQLYGTVESINDGKLLVEATSSVFNLPLGIKRITASDVAPVNVTRHSNSLESILQRTGTFPAGEYRICVYIKDAGTSQTLGFDCRQQVVEMSSAVTLVNPDDETVLQNMQISFTWLPVISKPGAQVTYMLKIAEVHGNQSSEDAMNNNPAFYESENITGTTFVYPSSANDFQAGKNYCWMVIAFLNSASLSHSEIWSFNFQSRSVAPAFDCSFISYTPLTLTANIQSKRGTQQLIDLLPESFGAMKVYFSCVDGSLYADGLDDNLQPYEIRGEVADTTARTAFGKRGIYFSSEGNFNLPEEFSPVKINFAGSLSEEGMTGSFEGIAIAASVSLTDTVRFEGNFAAHFITELKFNYFIYPYISIFRIGTISYEYSKKLDDYFDTCIEGAIDKDKKEEVLKKCVITTNKFMCFGDDARTSPPYLTDPDIDIYLSGTVCTISATTLLDEFIHAAGFVAGLGTSEDADHLFRDYVVECINMCVMSKGGVTNPTLINGSKQRIDTLLSNKNLSDNLDKFKKATGISISHK
jgi:hypothetical protein